MLNQAVRGQLGKRPTFRQLSLGSQGLDEDLSPASYRPATKTQRVEQSEQINSKATLDDDTKLQQPSSPEKKESLRQMRIRRFDSSDTIDHPLLLEYRDMLSSKMTTETEYQRL
jgi:hypothetical protein